MPSKRRILCVGDHEDTRALVSAILEHYEVVSAQTKTEALRRAEGGLFSLYLLDYTLPDGSGLELARLIRQFDDSTPILFITSPNTITDKQISDVGGQRLIVKDEFPDKLLDAISRMMS